MPDTRSDRKELSTVVPFPARRKRAPRYAGGPAAATSGNLALAASPAPTQKPVPFPTPGRWFSESHGSIGFRLFDIVYLFALARQALSAADAIEWGARYFSGHLSEQHGRTVLELLAPGRGDEPEAAELTSAIRQAFREAICQGAGRLLGRRELTPEDISTEDAKQLQLKLEELYARNGWLMPAVPFTLHRLLRYSKHFEY